MTSFSPLDVSNMNRIVSEESFHQLCLMLPQQRIQLQAWWSKQQVDTDNLTDMEVIMLSPFVKYGCRIIKRYGQPNIWSNSAVLIAIHETSISNLIARRILSEASNGLSISDTSKAANYCCANCQHTGVDRFNMRCVQCHGLGVLKYPRKDR